MGRVIAVANQKGGVGKTTTVLNLGAALAEKGKRVIMVDLDPQGALTAATGLDPYHVSPSSQTLISREEVRVSAVARPLGTNQWIVPANVNLSAVEYQLPKQNHRNQRLREKLKPIRGQLDFVLIDTPPSLGLLTTNALVAADELLIPVQCQYLAMRGVRALLETVWLIHERLHPDLQLLGLLPTMYDPNSPHAREVVREMRAVFGQKVFQTIIALEEAVAVSPAARKSVVDFRPSSRAAEAYRRLAQEICGD
jgi:chromosome partitioning protein